MKRSLHTLVISSAFGLAFALGACTAPEIESCESFRETRNSCEAVNGTYKPVNFDLCNNVDPECKEFYDCAAALPCIWYDNGRAGLGQERTDAKIAGKACVPRSVDPNCGKNCCPVDNYRILCPQPEDKECTDEDLRILLEPDDGA